MDDLEKTIALMGVSESVTIGQPTLGLVRAALVRERAARPVLDAADRVTDGWANDAWDVDEDASHWIDVLNSALDAYRAALGSAEAGAPAAEPASVVLCGDHAPFPSKPEQGCVLPAGHAASWHEGPDGEGWRGYPPLRRCVCGEPTTLGTVHRTDGPCWIPAGAGAPEPAQDDEPCLCGTDFTCLAREHEDGAALAAGAPQPPEADRG